MSGIPIMTFRAGSVKKCGFAIFFLVIVGLVRLAAAPPGASLSKDDVSLLLLGSSPSSKIVQIVEQRGVDFQMTPDLAKKFHDQGASDDLIDALRKAGDKAAAAKASAPAPSAAQQPNAPEAPDAAPEGKPNAPGATPPRASEPSPASAPSPDEPVLHTRGAAAEGSGPTPIATDRSAARRSPSATSEPVLHTRKSAESNSSSEGSAGTKTAGATQNDPATEKKIQEILDGLAGHPEPSGGEAPLLRIKDINGRKLTPEDFKGKVVLVNFWATWCPYCKTEIPVLVQLQQKYGWAGFQVVGIAVQDTEDKVKSFAAAHNVNYPVAMGDESYKSIYGGVNGLPTCFLMGRDGRIYQKIEGAPEDIGIFDKSVQALLKPPADKPTMAQANAPSSEPELHEAGKKTPPEIPVSASAPGLKDPSPQEIQHIIQEFAAKEKIFRAARNNYTYHQINKVQELGENNDIVGTFEQEWDIL